MFHPISSQVVLEPRTLAFIIFLKPVGTCAWTRTLGRPDSRRGNDGQRYAPRLQLLPWRVHHLHRRIPDDAPSTSRALHVSGQCCSLPRIQVAWKAPGCDLKTGMIFLPGSLFSLDLPPWKLVRLNHLQISCLAASPPQLAPRTSLTSHQYQGGKSCYCQLNDIVSKQCDHEHTFPNGLTGQTLAEKPLFQS